MSSSKVNLSDLALLEGTPASVAETQTRFGIKVGVVASLLVALGYHDAKKAILSGDPDQKSKGVEVMERLAEVCNQLAQYYLHLGLTLEAAQAAEIEGTAAAFAGQEGREGDVARNWCYRLVHTRDFSRVLKQLPTLEGDWLFMGLKFTLKLAKYENLSFLQRWYLVLLMVTKKHPDTLGRALWACELAPSKVEELHFLEGLQMNWELLDAAKAEQLERFSARIEELKAALLSA